MPQQGLDGRVLARQLGFGEQRMHLAVTHAMQELGLPPALALGNKVVRVALRWWNHAVAQRTNHDIAKPRVDHDFAQSAQIAEVLNVVP